MSRDDVAGPVVHFRLDAEMVDALDAIADELEASRSAVLRRAVKEHVKRVRDESNLLNQLDLELDQEG